MSRNSFISLIVVSVALVILLVPRSAVGAPVENDIVKFIKRIYADNGVQVTFSRLSQDIREAKELKNISFHKVPDAMGDGICLVSIVGQNGAEANIYVPFRVQAKRTLYSLRRNVKKGEVIRLADIDAKETFVQGSSAKYPLEMEEIVGKVAKKEMLAGQIILKQALEEQVVVTKGETVSMTVESRRLVVQTKGIAMEKGGVGDLVRVKSASGKEIVGRVTGNNSVRIEF